MKIVKLITFLMLIICIISVSSTVFGFDNIWQTGEAWLEGQSNTAADTDYNGLEQVTNIAWGIGIFVIVIGGTILGIRFMLVGGVEEKAEIKKQMMPFIIGTIVIVGALTIWKIIIEIMEGI